MIRDFLLSELALACSGELQGEDALIKAVTTDSREVTPGTLFVALKGERFDAHQFVASVASAGASGALVSEFQSADISQIRVVDRLAALGALGRFNRQQYQGQLVAVTGSAGKTSVKEMLALMLASKAPTLATKGNLNNEIGAPLTLLALEAKHQFAVIELGASGMGEIRRTVAMAQPDVAILNNAQAAHVEGFGSLQNIVHAKAEIYEGLKAGGIGIVNRDDPNADVWIDRLNELGRAHLCFGVDASADVRADNLKQRADGCFDFQLLAKGQSLNLSLNVMGRHMVSNALAAFAAWIALGLDPQAAIEPLAKYRGFKGRLQSHSLSNGIQLIDDSYNANPGSMRAAVDVLVSLKGPHTLVLGAMAELGDNEQKDHQDLGSYIANRGVNTLLATGELMRHCVSHARALGVEAQFFESQQDLLAALELINSGTILVKGSRSTAMDKVVTALLDKDA